MAIERHADIGQLVLHPIQSLHGAREIMRLHNEEALQEQWHKFSRRIPGSDAPIAIDNSFGVAWVNVNFHESDQMRENHVWMQQDRKPIIIRGTTVTLAPGEDMIVRSQERSAAA